MEDRSQGRFRMTWKSWTIVVTCFALLAVGVYVVRQQNGPAQAEAQAPIKQAPVNTIQAVAPTASTQRAVTAPSTDKKINTVAVVNREPITRSELATETLKRHGKEVLESLVNKHLILSECQKRNVVITDADINQEIANTAKKFNLSIDRWFELLKKERDVDPARYRRDIIWPTLALRKLATTQLEVTQEELNKAWESNYGAKVKVRMISVKDRGLAEELRAKAIADPASFEDLAKDFSQDPNSAAARGLIPPIRKHVGMKEIEETVFNLDENEISHVIFVANQYLIFKCEAHLPETIVPPQNIRDIQTRLVDKLRENKMRESAGDIFKSLQEKSEVVNVLNDPAQLQQNPGVAAFVNGNAISMQELEEECISRYGKEVLDGEINRKILIQSLAKHNQEVTEADLDAEIRRAAYAYGFLTIDGQADLEAWLNHVTKEQDVTVELYVRDAVWPTVALKKLVQNRVQISEEDLRKGFEANYGKRARVLAIVLDTQRRAQEVWDMARRNPSEKFFGELASQYSIEPVSKNNEGQVPPIQRYSGQPALEEEAFRLQSGELSGIVAVGNQFIILKGLGVTKPMINELAEVRDELERDIMEKKIRVEMSKEFELIRDSAQIDNFLANTTQVGKTLENLARKQLQGQQK